MFPFFKELRVFYFQDRLFPELYVAPNFKKLFISDHVSLFHGKKKNEAQRGHEFVYVNYFADP